MSGLGYAVSDVVAIWTLRHENGELIRGTAGIKVYVTEKTDQSTLPPEDRIPDCLEGIPVQILEESISIYNFLRRHKAMTERWKRHRPLLSGLRIDALKNENGTYTKINGGTLTGLATRNSDNKKLLVTNRHGMAAPTKGLT